jgi:hypothetical protein
MMIQICFLTIGSLRRIPDDVLTLLGRELVPFVGAPVLRVKLQRQKRVSVITQTRTPITVFGIRFFPMPERASGPQKAV